MSPFRTGAAECKASATLAGAILDGEPGRGSNDRERLTPMITDRSVSLTLGGRF